MDDQLSSYIAILAGGCIMSGLVGMFTTEHKLGGSVIALIGIIMIGVVAYDKQVRRHAPIEEEIRAGNTEVSERYVVIETPESKKIDRVVFYDRQTGRYRITTPGNLMNPQ